jgi:hypothetical protein
MKNLVRLVVLVGIISLACWGYPRPAAAFPETCGSIPQCSLTGKACTQDTVCCIIELGLFPCNCVNGHYQCKPE